MTALELHDTQGLVVSGYARMHEARYLLLEVVDGPAARRWMAELAGRVTNSAGPEERRCLNVALTCEGLATLGLQASELRSFPVAFREGMTAPHRQRMLADTGASGPGRWAWGGRADDAGDGGHGPVHVLLLLFAPDAQAMKRLEAEEIDRLEAGGLRVVHRLVPEPLPGRQSVGKFGVEHFGFADGMSQPLVAGTAQAEGLGGDERRRTVVEAGEMVLGYHNAYGQLPPLPALADGRVIGRNGTYLVVRQLAQDVAGFWRSVAERASGSGDGTGADSAERATWLASKLVGRWPSGAPLVLSHHRDDPDLGTENGFGFAEIDPHGERCPIGSHIRRANPRDSLGSDPGQALELANHHRIVRRGRVYGAAPEDPAVDDGVERGLLFLCLNASIERQFEFVQQSWINNPAFAGLYGEADPLLGNTEESEGRFTVQARPVRTALAGLPPFVTTRGGGYFFLPGVEALRMLVR